MPYIVPHTTYHTPHTTCHIPHTTYHIPHAIYTSCITPYIIYHVEPNATHRIHRTTRTAHPTASQTEAVAPKRDGRLARRVPAHQPGQAAADVRDAGDLLKGLLCPFSAPLPVQHLGRGGGRRLPPPPAGSQDSAARYLSLGLVLRRSQFSVFAPSSASTFSWAGPHRTEVF